MSTETSEILNTTPVEMVAGSTQEWSITLEHPPSDGFTCEFRLAGADAVTITATPSDDEESYDLRLAPADTNGWNTGDYWYHYVTSDGTDEYVEVTGQIRINGAIASAPHDARSVAKQILDAIDALVLNRATIDQQSYQIGNRQLSRIPFDELLPMRKYYAAIYDQEIRAARLKAGKSLWPTIKLKFT